jgi:hypothetical protein
MPKDKVVETYNSDKIYVKGLDLQRVIYERVQQIEKLRADLLQEVTAQLRESCGPDDDPVEKAAGLIIVLEDGYNLSVHARMIRASLERAAEVQREHRELSLFGRTLMRDAIYELTWEEADRFGV